MALNPDRVGHRYPPYRYEVSREKLREYAVATGVTDPRYKAEEGEIVALPAFAACFTIDRGGQALLADPELGAHPSLLHASQDFELHRPLQAGDVLHCEPMITEIKPRGRNDWLTLEISCVDANDGSPVLTSRGTLVFFEPEDDRDEPAGNGRAH